MSKEIKYENITVVENICNEHLTGLNEDEPNQGFFSTIVTMTIDYLLGSYPDFIIDSVLLEKGDNGLSINIKGKLPSDQIPSN